jgi:hypothetical protein
MARRFSYGRWLALVWQSQLLQFLVTRCLSAPWPQSTHVSDKPSVTSPSQTHG